MIEGVILRLTHAQRVLPAPPYAVGTFRNTSLYIDDLRDTENQRGLVLPPQYIPFEASPGVPGFIDIVFTSLVARSFETGDIRRLLAQGEVTHQFFVGGTLQRGMDGAVLVTATAGAPSPDVYAASINDSMFLVDSALDIVRVNLPSGASHRRGWFRFVDIGGQAGTNNIVIWAFAGDTIGGGVSYTISTDHAALAFFWDGNDWFPTGWPIGAAGGDLSGTYPNPDVRAIHETSGPTQLIFGAVTDGQYLKRVGATVVGVAGGPVGAAGGDLGGTYPNPDVTALHETGGPTQLVLGAVADGQYLKRMGATVIGAAGGGGGGAPNIVTALATPYAAGVDADYVLVRPVVPVPFVVNLPAGGLHTNKVITVKDKTGTAALNNITINANGIETIDGAAFVKITANFAALTFVFSGTEWSVV